MAGVACGPRIAVDVMSGDRTPRDYVAGVAQALQDDAEFSALLVGDPTAIESAKPPSATAPQSSPSCSRFLAAEPMDSQRSRNGGDLRFFADFCGFFRC